MQNDPFDYLVVGAGLVGLVCALALSKAGFKVAIIEANKLQQSPLCLDRRAIALTDLSCRWLSCLGLWEALQDSGSPIDNIHVSLKNRR